MHRRLRPLIVLLVVLGGCGSEPAAPVDRETFVDALVALRRAATDGGSSEAFGPRRATVLAEAGVTEEDLRAYVAAWDHDPAHMAAVWADVRDRLQGSVDPDMQEEEGGPLGDSDMPLEEETLDEGLALPETRTPEGNSARGLPRPGGVPRARTVPPPPPDTSAARPAAAYSHSMVAGGFELTS